MEKEDKQFREDLLAIFEDLAEAVGKDAPAPEVTVNVPPSEAPRVEVTAPAAPAPEVKVNAPVTINQAARSCVIDITARDGQNFIKSLTIKPNK